MSNHNFSSAELERYSRHISIPEIGIEGQQKLKAAKVLVVGSGGLGSPLLLYLAAAGIGKIGIVDFDVVDDSNLQRQVLFSQNDIGRPKVEAAKEKLLALNPHIIIDIYNEKITAKNAKRILEHYNIVADGTDNFQTRYLINDACVLLNKINVYASIYRFEGQVSVFNYTTKQGEVGPNYRDIFPSPPPPGTVPNCAEAGVLGVLPGIIGSIQANEVIKLAAKIGEPLSGKLFLFDALAFDCRTLKIRKDPNNPLTGNAPTQTSLIDYDEFCGLNIKPMKENVKEISVKELKKLFDGNEDFQIIDVREEYEYDIVNLNAKLIPLNSILNRTSEIEKEKKVIIHCRSGVRSANAIEALQEKFGYKNLYNLKGGILAYSKEIDNTLATY